jgi:hypothetical protein
MAEVSVIFGQDLVRCNRGLGRSAKNGGSGQKRKTRRTVTLSDGSIELNLLDMKPITQPKDYWDSTVRTRHRLTRRLGLGDLRLECL